MHLEGLKCMIIFVWLFAWYLLYLSNIRTKPKKKSTDVQELRSVRIQYKV
jgi:hypothetical protein